MDDFSQIYNNGIAVAYKCSRPEDCLVLLMLMVNQNLTPSEKSMFYVLRSLTDAGTAVQCEEDTRLFGLMPKWGVARDTNHTACFVEALASLGRLGDAYLALSHMEKTAHLLSPMSYSVVLCATLDAMRIKHSNYRVGKAGKKIPVPRSGVLGGGKHSWTEAEAAEAVASMLVHVTQVQAQLEAYGSNKRSPLK